MLEFIQPDSALLVTSLYATFSVDAIYIYIGCLPFPGEERYKELKKVSLKLVQEATYHESTIEYKMM